jgi:predicted dehydrogenase
VRDLNARVMVSMNRRFDPLLRDALAWIGDRPIRSIKALMTRRGRTEPEFVEHTGLHLVDLVRMIGGDVNGCSALRHDVIGTAWFEARLAFASGASGVVELMPTFGSNSESLEIAGANYRVKIRSSEFDFGDWRAWAEGRLVVDESIPPATSMFVANGTLAETEAFVHALRSGKEISPSPADVLPSMELCHAITQGRSAHPKTIP